MKQYSSIELDNKIHSFMSSKLKQFSDLDSSNYAAKQKATKAPVAHIFQLWLPSRMKTQF